MWEGGREGGSLAVSHSESLNLSILHPGQQNFLNISQEAQADSSWPGLGEGNSRLQSSARPRLGEREREKYRLV